MAKKLFHVFLPKIIKSRKRKYWRKYWWNGNCSSSPEFTAEHLADFNKNILEPTVKGIKDKALDFVGIIFFGVLVQDNQCYLLEYNMRFGDQKRKSSWHF